MYFVFQMSVITTKKQTDNKLQISVFFFKHYHHITLMRFHYDDVIMSTMASKITSLTIVYSTVYSVADQRKHQSSASLAFVRGFHRGPVNSPQKWLVTRKIFQFHDVIMVAMSRRD